MNSEAKVLADIERHDMEQAAKDQAMIDKHDAEQAAHDAAVIAQHEQKQQAVGTDEALDMEDEEEGIEQAHRRYRELIKQFPVSQDPPYHCLTEDDREIVVRGTLDMGKGVKPVEFAIAIFATGKMRIDSRDVPEFWAELAVFVYKSEDGSYVKTIFDVTEGSCGRVGVNRPKLHMVIDTDGTATLTCKNNPAFRVQWKFP
jgi:hypothetical protein